jgi:hypothetical protein
VTHDPSIGAEADPGAVRMRDGIMAETDAAMAVVY